jgi:APA family basic amino acid/polyamine antiporter
VGIAYVLANIAYYLNLEPAQIRQSHSVAATALNSVIGGTASTVMVGLILVSIIGAMNGMILTGPRVYYAMAEERLFFSMFAKISSRFHVPVWAILIQGLWAAYLTLLGTFQELFTCVVFTAWIFYGLAVLGVVVLRIRRPEIRRPFRVPGYPVLPVLFVVAACGITLAAVVASLLRATIGMGLIFSGLPIFGIFFSRQSTKVRMQLRRP